MKLPVLAAVLTAMALTASAAPDPGAGVYYGNNVGQPSPDAFASSRNEPLFPAYISPRGRARIDNARGAFRLACVADRETLCAGRSARRMDECLAYHRLRLSASCKTAMDNLSNAYRDAS